MNDARWRHPGLWLSALIIAISAEVSRTLAFADGGLSLFWPVAGMGFAMAHRWGWAGVGALWLGLVAWAVVAYPQVGWAAPLVGLAGTVGPLLVWRLTQALARQFVQPFDRLQGVVRIMAAQLLVGSPVAALVGTSLFVWLDPDLATSGLPGWGTLLSYVAVYWIIESCGALLVAPLAWDVLIRQRKAGLAQRLQLLADAFRGHGLITAAVVALAAGLAAAFALTDSANARAFSYLVLPLLVMVAHRCNGRASHLLLAGTGLLITAMSAYAMQRVRSADTASLGELLLLVLFMLVSAGVVQMLVALNTERREALQRLDAQAHTDPLTGLGNEAGLYREVQGFAPQDATPTGLALLQLVNWQAIEQLDGPQALTTLELSAARLLCSESPQWYWARLGTGQLAGWSTTGGIEAHTLDGLASILNTRYQGDAATPATVAPLWRACGVVMGPTPAGGVAVSSLIARLREASLLAGDATQSPVLAVENNDGERLRAQAQAIEDVRRALREGRLALWAQPIGNGQPDPATEQAPLKCEILVRLLDDHGQVVSPGRFLPAAMQGGLMQSLDREVIDRTFAWFAAHPTALQHIDYCSINLSAPSLGNPGLTQWIQSRLQAHGVPAARFTFEITESQAIAQPRQASQTITELRALGCRVAIDDFGTGHATFDYLKRFAVDIVKIDGSFIKDLHLQPLDRAIVRSMVDIAKLLHVHTVAEHVDHPDVVRWARQLGIDDIQGYWLGRPQPMDKLFERLDTPEQVR